MPRHKKSAVALPIDDYLVEALKPDHDLLVVPTGWTIQKGRAGTGADEHIFVVAKHTNGTTKRQVEFTRRAMQLRANPSVVPVRSFTEHAQTKDYGRRVFVQSDLGILR